MTDDPHPDQTLPEDLEEAPEGGPPPRPDQTLPGDLKPRGREDNRGRDEEARDKAPGQNKP